MYTTNPAMTTAPVVFEHTATYSRPNGLDVVVIEITFDGTYTIKLTHAGPSVCIASWPKEISYIRDIQYLPKSLLYMLSATGDEFGSVRKLIQILTQLCTETLESEKKEIESNLQSELASAAKQIEELQYDLALSRRYISELQMRNQEFYDKLYPSDENIDTILDNALDELDM